MTEVKKCGKDCEVYSRVVGYYRPIKHWNKGKTAEFEERKDFSVEKAMKKVEEQEEVVK